MKVVNEMPNDDLTYERFIEVLEQATNKGWASKIVCATHDGLPRTEEEDADWEQGLDPCVPAVRLWDRDA